MQVTSGADWFTAADNKRSYAISFDLDDLAQKVGADIVEKMSFPERVKALNNMADAYVVAYVAKEGGMPQEFARKRLAELSNDR